MGNLPKNTYKSQVLKELPIKNGQKSLNVQEQLARSVQGELERIGIDLPPDYYRNHKRLLSVVYMITSLAVVFVESKDGSGYSSYVDSVKYASEIGDSTEEKQELLYMISDKKLEKVKSRIYEYNEFTEEKRFKSDAYMFEEIEYR